MVQNGNITLKQAIEGHTLMAKSAGFSPHTLTDYGNTFKFFTQFMKNENVLIKDITHHDAQSFLAHMGEEEFLVARGVAAGSGQNETKKRSKKTLKNYYLALSALWSWALKEGYVSTHIMEKVTPPRAYTAPIEPLNQEQIKALIKYANLNRKGAIVGIRDQAIVTLLVETALRASELCDIKIKDVDFIRGLIKVKGKGEKSRYVAFRAQTKRRMMAWLNIRGDYEASDWLFCSIARDWGEKLSVDGLGRMIRRLGQKAKVKASTKDLRTTAACHMVKNGITAWELKRIMGHESIDTTMRYVRAAKVDIIEAMKRASPIEHL